MGVRRLLGNRNRIWWGGGGFTVALSSRGIGFLGHGLKLKYACLFIEKKMGIKLEKFLIFKNYQKICI